MKNLLVNVFLPHSCCSCGQLGDILCKSCSNDIIYEPYQLSPLSSDIDAGFCLGVREGALADLVTSAKGQSVRSAAQRQGELLATILPSYAGRQIIVPVPTNSSHIRQRGYDHTKLMARTMAHRLDVEYATIVERIAPTVQIGASKKTREDQARRSYRVPTTLQPDACYVIVDDVYTTGATVRSIARLLRDAGACTVWCAITCQQTLD